MKKIKDLIKNKREVKLDIGCGFRRTSEDYIGIDKVLMPGVDIRCDLEKEKLPFENNSVDEINVSHFLEHISNNNYINVISEMWRTLKPEGKLLVKVPHYKHGSAYTDPTHIRKFTRQSFNFFDERKVLYKETGWYLSHARFKINNIKESEKEIFYDLTSKKKRILLVAPRNSVHTKRWKEYLLSTSHDVKVASRLLEVVADFGLGKVGLDKEKQIEKMPEALENILSENNFDVVQTHYSTKYGHVLKSVPKNIRKILSVWGEDVLDEAKNNSLCKARLIKGLDYANYITTTSEYMSNFLQEKYNVDKNKLWVIPWGYGDEFFAKDVNNNKK
jgi:predicted SAM-dependent methyltransferase